MSTGRKSRIFHRCFWLTFLVVSLAYAGYSFYAPGNRIAWADDYATAMVNAGFIPVTIDVHDVNAADTLRQYGVKATPSTIITDSNGNVLQDRQGGMSKAEFLGMLGTLNLPVPEPQ